MTTQSRAIRPHSQNIVKFVIFMSLMFRNCCHYLCHSTISQSRAISSQRPKWVNLAQREPRDLDTLILGLWKLLINIYSSWRFIFHFQKAEKVSTQCAMQNTAWKFQHIREFSSRKSGNIRRVNKRRYELYTAIPIWGARNLTIVPCCHIRVWKLLWLVWLRP